MDVLIIDDDAQVRDVHRRLLERAGYMVTAVDNGLAALAALQEQRFQVIVCDVQMPFLKGQSFYDALADAFPAMRQRVVFVTGWGDDPEVRTFLANTGRPALHKPVEPKELVAMVRRIAERPSRG